MKTKAFKVGDQVFAKVKGYPAWPAKITGVAGKKYNVRFYGTGEVGCIKAEDLFYYLKHKQSLIRVSKRKDYNDALADIEKVVEQTGTDGNEDPDGALTDVSISSVTPSERGPPSKRKRSGSYSSEDTPRKSNRRSSTTGLKDLNVESNNEKEGNAKFKKLTEVKSSSPVVKGGEIQQHPSALKRKRRTNYNIEPKLVSAEELKSYIAYAKYVRSKEEIFRVRPEDPREDHKNQILAIKLPDGTCKAIKLHQSWPINCNNEYDRALYDERVALRLLKLKNQLENGTLNPKDETNIFFEDFKLSEEVVALKLKEAVLKSKRAKVERLKCEAALVELDTKIKSCLGLDKANPKEALVHLKALETTDVDDLMLIKHAHVFEMIRRLRKYVGNNDDWKMTEKELNTFQNDAALLRETADKIWEKFKSLIKVPEKYSDFWEGFNKIVYDFRQQVKHLNEKQILLIDSEPFSRRFFMDQYDERDLTKKPSDENKQTKGTKEALGSAKAKPDSAV